MQSIEDKLADAEKVLEKIHARLTTTTTEEGYGILLEIEAWKRRSAGQE